MNGQIIRVDKNSVRLCCNKKNCPVVTDLGNGIIQITDDDGKTITMKQEEAEILSDGAKLLKGEKLILG